MRGTKVVFFIFNLVILLLLITTGAEAKLITGTFTYKWQGLTKGFFFVDFSEAKLDTVAIGRTWRDTYDLAWVFGEGYLFIGQLVYLRRTDLSEIKTAPEKGYDIEVPDEEGAAYVCITKEGHYVKFKVTSERLSRGATILEDKFMITLYYVYQTDGSRNLDESTIVKPSGWGKIKWLLRKGGE